MAKTKRAYILGAFFCSALSAVLNIVALSTDFWVDAQSEIVVDQTNDELSEINYGLFSGILKQNYGGPAFYELKVTCDFGVNVCAMLCGNTNSDRAEELARLYNDESVTFDSSCPSIARILTPRQQIRTSSVSGNREFINAGVWLSTVIFLILSTALGAFAAGISAWNTVANPVESYFNIFGLYIYNTAACLCSLLVVLLWGILYATYIFNNVGILYTITSVMDSKGLAYLGFSYWFNLISFIFYGLSIGLLYVRQYLINKDPIVKDINLDDTSDPTLYIY